ncbi:MAG TPA: M24 family metallopeptidase, partial [Acholeplasma sp.]
KPFKVGQVITVEPGLYVAEEGIGVRIEDNVVLTETGCINLSEDLIKEVDDIEVYLAKV